MRDNDPDLLLDTGIPDGLDATGILDLMECRVTREFAQLSREEAQFLAG